jgi:hypothetical protein
MGDFAWLPAARELSLRLVGSKGTARRSGNRPRRQKREQTPRSSRISPFRYGPVSIGKCRAFKRQLGWRLLSIEAARSSTTRRACALRRRRNVAQRPACDHSEIQWRRHVHGEFLIPSISFDFASLLAFATWPSWLSLPESQSGSPKSAFLRNVPINRLGRMITQLTAFRPPDAVRASGGDCP